MKLTAIILLSACLTASATGEAQGITVNEKAVSPEKVFDIIKKQTGYTFWYKLDLIEGAKKIDIKVTNASLTEVLNICTAGQRFTYEIIDNTVVIKERKTSPNENAAIDSEPLPPPPIDISGKVTDKDGNPLAGAYITVKGKAKLGATTDNEGVFVLKGLEENDVIVISFSGYKEQTYKVGTATSFLAKLEIKDNPLDEVQIIAYGTQSKRFSVGNISTVKAADIEKQPVQNPLLALQGRVTGVQITQLTGLPGGGTSVQIQGRNSIGQGLDPLIVVDGVPYPSNFGTAAGRDILVQGGSPLNYINTNDIESIDVLKDADATSIYGSRAANGAILITTKKGKAGKTKLSVNIQQGWGKVGRKIDMMNTRQYLDMRYEAFRNDNFAPSSNPSAFPNYAPELTIWDTTRYTDWQKVLIGGTAEYTNVDASISGGNNSVQYRIGATYRRQTTVFPGNYDDKVGGIHFNINGNSADKKLSVQLSGNYLYDNNHLPNVDLTRSALLLAPVAPTLFNPDGTLNWAPDASGNSTWTNPLASIYGADYNKTTKNLVANLVLNYTILPGWTVGSSLGYTSMQNYNYMPIRLEARAPELRPTGTRVSGFLNNNQSNWILEPQMKYARNLGRGKIEGLVGATFQKNTGGWLDIDARGYANDQLMNSPSSAPTISSLSSSSVMYKYNAVFGRLNYNWREKYILNLTGRRDGSSRFGDNNKFHNFASVGAAWIFSAERLMESNLPFLSFGKLRGSFGTTGNDQIGDYQYISTYGTSIPGIPYQGGTGLMVTKIPNPNLQWEETKKWQAGIDLGFYKDRILLGATYARNESSNQLISYVVPSITGFTFIIQNFPATIRNTSWEFTLHTVNIKGKDFSWSTDFNLTIPRNKLVKFPGIEKTGYLTSTTAGVIVGQPLGILQRLQYGGVNPATGLYYPLDRNSQPVYYPNSPNSSLDQTSLISLLPKFSGGLINAFKYKRFQLEFVFQFVRQMGLDEFNYHNGASYPGTGPNQPAAILNKKRWQKPGDNADIAKYSMYPFGNGTTVWPNLSDAGYTYDASFIRLKNISLNWQCPTNWAKKAGLQSATIYVHGQNLATITKYKSLDPETRSNSSLPPLQMWTIGAKLDF